MLSVCFALCTGVILNAFIPSKVIDDAIYVPRNRQYAVILRPHSGILHVFTTAKKPDNEALAESIRRRYRSFMVSRQLDSIDISNVSGLKISRPESDLILTDRLVPLNLRKRNVILLVRGFGVDSINKSEWPDSVYISPCVNHKVATALSSRLDSAGIVSINLKDTALVIE